MVTLCAPATRAVELEWQAPPGCPTTEAVKRDVKRLAGSAEGTALVARAAVTQTADQRWRVAIDLTGAARGHRTLTADTCLQLARASALIIALAANPEAALDLSTDEPVGPHTGTRTPASSDEAGSATSTSRNAAAPSSSTDQSKLPDQETTSVTPTVSESEDRRQGSPATPKKFNRHHWAVFAHAGFENGSLPTPTAWVGVGVRHHLQAIPLGLTVSTLATQGTRARYDNGVGADFRLFAAHALGCLQPHTEPWLVAACVGAQFAVTHAQGHFESGRSEDPSVAGAEIFTRYRWNVAPAALLLLGYELFPSVSFEVGAAISIPPTRWEFVVDGVGPLYRTSGQQVMLLAGLGVLL